MGQALAAEQLPPDQIMTDRPRLYTVPDPDLAEVPRVYAPEEMSFEAETRAHFDQWIGSVVVSAAGKTAETAETVPNVNVLERIKAAKAGDPEAKKWFAINVATAVYEAVFKKGYVGETYMDRTTDGQLVQFGQTNGDIHHNAIAFRPGRHPILQDITEAEALNRHRIEAALDAGVLDDYYYVVFSLVPNGVPERELGPGGDGYFLDSLTMSIQATAALPNGRVKTETAFMAGVEEEEGDTFRGRLARRHDFQAVAMLDEQLGHEAPDTAPERLRSGRFIPKAMMPNGVADVMYWLDLAGDQVLDRKFERKPEDYMGLRLESKRREASLDDVREKVMADVYGMIEGVAEPAEAIQLIWDSVREHATTASLTNLNIDPKVFGRAAAADIDMARYHFHQGNRAAAFSHMEKAREAATISGCGGGSTAEDKESSDGEASDPFENKPGHDRYGRRLFWCSNRHPNLRPHNKLIDKCQHAGCTAKVACGPDK